MYQSLTVCLCTFVVWQGRTALHVSAWQGHYEMVRLLLTLGRADVSAVDRENRTALHSASWQGHAPIVQLLLDHGAQADHTCNQGATALGMPEPFKLPSLFQEMSDTSIQVI